MSLPVMLRRARATYGVALRGALVEAGFHDVPQNGLYVFSSLDLDGEWSPMGDLIAGLGLTKQAGGQLVDVMVSKGYVERRPDLHDRRKLVVSLTVQGRAAARVQRGARERIDAELADLIGAAEIDRLRKALTALITLGGVYSVTARDVETV